MATGKALNKTTVYYGPSSSLYPSEGSSVGPNETVTIVWKEGSWYFIEYVVTSTGKRKRMYIPTSAISNISGSVTSKSLTKTTKTSSSAPTYTGPGPAYATAGSVGNETVSAFNEVSGSYTFIEYSISGGQKKRAYILTDKLSTPSTKIIKDPINPSSNYSYGSHKDYSVSKGTPVYAMCDGSLAIFYCWGKKTSGSVDSYVSLGIGAALTPASGWKTAAGSTPSKIDYGHLGSINGYSFPAIATSQTEAGIKHPTKLFQGGEGYGYEEVFEYHKVSKGTKTVKCGDLIGYSGNTGNSSGPHLHIELS